KRAYKNITCISDRPRLEGLADGWQAGEFSIEARRRTMGSEVLRLIDLGLGPDERKRLETNPAARQALENRLIAYSAALQGLQRSDLVRFVTSLLKDILEKQQRARPSAGVIARREVPRGPLRVTDDELDRKFGHALQKVPSHQIRTVREKIRRGMALD